MPAALQLRPPGSPLPPRCHGLLAPCPLLPRTLVPPYLLLLPRCWLPSGDFLGPRLCAGPRCLPALRRVPLRFPGHPTQLRQEGPLVQAAT